MSANLNSLAKSATGNLNNLAKSATGSLNAFTKNARNVDLAGFVEKNRVMILAGTKYGFFVFILLFLLFLLLYLERENKEDRAVNGEELRICRIMCRQCHSGEVGTGEEDYDKGFFGGCDFPTNAACVDKCKPDVVDFLKQSSNELMGATIAFGVLSFLLIVFHMGTKYGTRKENTE